MSATMVIVVGALAAIGTYLVTSRVLSRIVLGFAMLGHAAVLALTTAGGAAGDPPLADRTTPAESSNPLPQALSLTAIVISFGLTLFLLALARRQRELSGDDLVEDDLEDRRIAADPDDGRISADGERRIAAADPSVRRTGPDAPAGPAEGTTP